MIKELSPNTLWIADDESYGQGKILLIDTKDWSSEDYKKFDEAYDSEKWETALAIEAEKTIQAS